MSKAPTLRFYLDPGLKQSAETGQHNFLNKVAEVAAEAGFRLEYRTNSAENRAKCAKFTGYSLFHMEEPANPRGVTVRRVYHYPFWGIEPSGKRWEWHVARTAFDPAQVHRKEADRFAAFWRKRLFNGLEPVDEGFVYAPLQGRLTQTRSFQSQSPLEMLQTVLDHDDRPVIATLHPKETYTSQELSALHALANINPRLTIRTGQMEQLLPACSYVATQNSSAAFNGYFFGKPAILFGQIDFHHIAANVPALGVTGAFQALRDLNPDFSGYLWWFWQVMSVNAGRPEAKAQIAAALRRAGWPID